MSEDEAGPSTHPRPTVAELELCGMKPRNRDRARIGNIARRIANFDPKHEVKYSALCVLTGHFQALHDLEQNNGARRLSK